MEECLHDVEQAAYHLSLIHILKEEWAKDLVAWPWCISEIVKAHEDCPELQAVLDEYHKPAVIQDQVLGELTLDKDHDTFEGEIQWCGKDVHLSLEVNAESKPSWTHIDNLCNLHRN